MAKVVSPTTRVFDLRYGNFTEINFREYGKFAKIAKVFGLENFHLYGMHDHMIQNENYSLHTCTYNINIHTYKMQNSYTEKYCMHIMQH